MDGSLFKKLYFYCALPLILTSGCNHHKEYHRQLITQVPRQVQAAVASTQDTSPVARPTITVWVHGTRAFSKTVFPNFFRTIPGMHHASVYNKKNNLLTIAQTLSVADSLHFPFENMYIFGWSGKLSAEVRLAAARKLYHALILLVEQYIEKYSIAPRIRLITHSHGGNIALYLAKVQKHMPIKLEIEELVLLACPVQIQTMKYVSNNMFKKMYSFYSRLDLLQILDPQGIYALKNRILGKKKKKKNTPLFSERTFPEQDNLKQIKVKKGGRAIMHVEFIKKSFVHHLPGMLDELRTAQGNTKKLMRFK